MSYATSFGFVDKLLVTLNILFWAFNLLFVLFAGAVPQVPKTTFVCQFVHVGSSHVAGGSSRTPIRTRSHQPSPSPLVPKPKPEPDPNPESRIPNPESRNLSLET
jgi:hypothetical protein